MAPDSIDEIEVFGAGVSCSFDASTISTSSSAVAVTDPVNRESFRSRVDTTTVPATAPATATTASAAANHRRPPRHPPTRRGEEAFESKEGIDFAPSVSPTHPAPKAELSTIRPELSRAVVWRTSVMRIHQRRSHPALVQNSDARVAVNIRRPPFERSRNSMRARPDQHHSVPNR